MKLNCGLTKAERTELLEEEWKAFKKENMGKWKPFFAIWPRRVGKKDCRWLETIERRMVWASGQPFYYVEWEYRAITKPEVSAKSADYPYFGYD